VTHKNGQLVEVLPELYKPVEGFVDAFQKARRRAFAETSARGIKGPRQWAYVNRAMEETRAFLRGEAQLIVPQNPDLLW
jgi:hypothetical protein